MPGLCSYSYAGSNPFSGSDFVKSSAAKTKPYQNS